MDKIIIRCGECGLLLNDDIYQENSDLCPNCGSVKRHIITSDSEEACFTVHEQIGTKIIRKGIRKPIREEISGDDYSVSRKKWVSKERIIDRENDKYYEEVKDIETGAIIHKCSEALSNHSGHGSAKKT